MRKIKKRFFGLCLGFALTLGVGIGLSSAHKEAIGIEAAGSATVTFGNTNVKVTSTNFKFSDSAGTSWTIVTGGTNVSIANQGGSPQWTQFGNKATPATSITLTGDFNGKTYNITNFSTKWGGFSDTAGTIVAKVGGTQIASGSLSGTSDVTISQASSSSISGENLTISVTNISKGVKLYSLSYSYEESSSGETYTVSFNGNGAEGTMADVTDASDQYTLPESTFTAPNGKAFAGWKANNEGDLVAAGDKYTLSADTTFYAQWVNSYSVTFTAGENGTGSYVDSNQPEGTYTLPAFDNLTGITANTGYQFYNYSINGETKYSGNEITLSSDITVDVIFGIERLNTTYDFTTKFSTYAQSWSSYGTHEGLNGKTDIGGDYNAAIDLYYASKQTGSSSITTMPVFATKTTSGSWTKVLQFTLTETGYKIDNITVTFAQWGTKTPSISLYKGAEVSGTALDTATIGTKNTLIASNFNGTTFSVGYSDGSSDRVQSGLKSIYIEMSAASTFGTLDHIKIAQAPTTTVYHVGETFDSTGLSVMAYDGADEDTANFKDVTSEVEMLLDNTYEFLESDVPGMDEEVTYEGKTATFHVYVYAVGEYNLVTKNLNNWSGKYLIVGVDKNSYSKTVAMDSYLSAPDSANNYEVVDESNSIINTGKELEWTISKMDGGYSIKGQSGKYIGSFETTKDSGLVASGTALLNTISIDGTSGEATIKGTNGYSLKFNNASSANRFRYYSGGTVKLYRLADSEDALIDAEIFAETFNAQIGCDPNGLSEPVGWESIKADWEATSVEAQIILSNVDLSTETNEEIKNCITTYEYIINKYNQSNPTKYNDFMGRNLVSAKANVVYQTNNSDTPILIVVLVSFVSVTAIGGYVFLRKRKIS